MTLGYPILVRLEGGGIYCVFVSFRFSDLQFLKTGIQTIDTNKYVRYIFWTGLPDLIFYWLMLT